ncbi:MAG: carbamoyltransferase HypF [Xanthomonadales bacterium]|nr:carbamoyltransferase HypF [Xanthomonadales bacterium]
MDLHARKLVITGRVQGVGYRPFVYNRAIELGLAGTVLNGAGKVFVHVEGPGDALDRLEHDLQHDAPPLARPVLNSSEGVPVEGLDGFSILSSESATEAEIHVPPDLFTCGDCLAELTSPEQRRFGYPFINCTQCGPRYTLITAMPYDRPNTSMAGFPLCNDCRDEYENPADRRFHAQPLACAVCGPSLEFEQERALVSAEPLDQAVRSLQDGLILAIKGVGGYHLVCDACNERAVQRLRARKRRPDKPLAVMFPMTGHDGLATLRDYLKLDDTTEKALLDPARPIVLVAMRGAEVTEPLSSALAPELRELGAFLPYSPLHHELLARFGRPIVATSGNVSGEPVITDNDEARERLAGVADGFLHHDRPIVRPADDPVVRPTAGKARIIRLGRGMAPLERPLPIELKQPLLATGGHMKNTVALAWGKRVVLSPHVGDLDSPRSNDIFRLVINNLKDLYQVKYNQIACDLHPGYASTRWALESGLPVVQVQHHAAHASSLAGEHPEVRDWLVFTWDGVGFGSDGDLWGGEALHGGPGRWRRVASFRPFRLIGGDRAGREPWRSAAALLWAENAEVNLGMADGAVELAFQAWQKELNTFQTSAVGRLFDAAAALVLGRTMASFEGQGPMELEQVSRATESSVALPLEPDRRGVLRADWSPLLAILQDKRAEAEHRASVFHETMARTIVDQAKAVRARCGFEAVGLSGGVFQNRLLVERATDRLEAAGFEVRLHENIPANDGGLCFGQVIEAAARQNR